jgi:hypothetical protein
MTNTTCRACGSKFAKDGYQAQHPGRPRLCRSCDATCRAYHLQPCTACEKGKPLAAVLAHSTFDATAPRERVSGVSLVADGTRGMRRG